MGERPAQARHSSHAPNRRRTGAPAVDILGIARIAPMTPGLTSVRSDTSGGRFI
jgi:hypothetical protein